MSKFKNNSRIFEAVYETACDLHSVGAINDERMNEYKEACLKPKSVKIHGDILECVNQKYGSNRKKLETLINDIVRKELKLTPTV